MIGLGGGIHIRIGFIIKCTEVSKSSGRVRSQAEAGSEIRSNGISEAYTKFKNGHKSYTVNNPCRQGSN